MHVMPWDIGRLKVTEFEQLVTAAEFYRDHDTRYARGEE